MHDCINYLRIENVNNNELVCSECGKIFKKPVDLTEEKQREVIDKIKESIGGSI